VARAGLKGFVSLLSLFQRSNIISTRPVTSLGHQRRRRVFWEGPKFFKLCPNGFELCPTQFSRGGDASWLRAWL